MKFTVLFLLASSILFGQANGQVRTWPINTKSAYDLEAFYAYQTSNLEHLDRELRDFVQQVTSSHEKDRVAYLGQIIEEHLDMYGEVMNELDEIRAKSYELLVLKYDDKRLEAVIKKISRLDLRKSRAKFLKYTNQTLSKEKKPRRLRARSAPGPFLYTKEP